MRRIASVLRVSIRNFKPTYQPNGISAVFPDVYKVVNKVKPSSVTEEFSKQVDYFEAEARIAKLVKDFPKINLGQFTMEKKFKELGLDSLETIHFITTIEAEFNLVFEENVFDGFQSCKDIARYISTTKHAI